ncbi:hypothetical protein [Aeromicrobium sp.]
MLASVNHKRELRADLTGSHSGIGGTSVLIPEDEALIRPGRG